MTGPEHYREAEKLLGYAANIDAEDRGCASEASLFAEAQVHATLALAAATALNDAEGGLSIREHEAWCKTAGTQAGEAR